MSHVKSASKSIGMPLLLMLSNGAALAQQSQAPDVALGQQRMPGVIDCSGEKVRTCTYTPVNRPATEIVTIINKTLFSGATLTSDPRGHLEVIDGGNTISFWYDVGPATDPDGRGRDTLDRLKEAVRLHDHFYDFTGKPMVQLSVAIYSITESGYTGLKANLTGLSFGPDIGTGRDFGVKDGNVELSLNMGSAKLSGIIGAQRRSGVIRDINQVNQLVPNGQSVAFTNGRTTYVPLVTSVQTIASGVSLAGTAQLSRQDGTLVQIGGFSLSWHEDFELPPPGFVVGTPVTGPGGFSISQSQLTLTKGVPMVLVTNYASKLTKALSGGIGGFGRSDDKERNRLMVVITANPKSYDEYVRECRMLAQVNTVAAEFALAERDEVLARRGAGRLADIVQSLAPFAAQGPDGSPLLGFTFDRKLATRDNLDQMISVSVEGGGIKQKKDVELQNAMAGEFVFQTLPQNKVIAEDTRFKVKIKPLPGFWPEQDEDEEFELEMHYFPSTGKLRLPNASRP